MLISVEAILQNCHLLARVTEPSRSALLTMATVRCFAGGEMILRKGEPCPGIFIVGEGLVRIYVLSPQGKQQIVHQATPGNTFAEVATIGDFACPAFAEAAIDTVCALLPGPAFQRALHDDHQLCLQLLSGLASRVHHFFELVEDLTLRNAAGRVARFILEAADAQSDLATLPGLKKDLANQLNLTSETFSRTLRRFIDAGLIAAQDGQVLKIRSRSQLQRVSDGLFPRL